MTTKTVISQQQQKLKSKQQKRSQFPTGTESLESSRLKSRAAHIRELRQDWEDAP